MSSKVADITMYMYNNNINIAAIQETKLTSRSNLQVKDGYTVIRQDRATNSGGGLAFLVHKSIQFASCDLPTDPNPATNLEQQAINIQYGGKSITFINVYIPPPRAAAAQITPPLQPTFWRRPTAWFWQT